LRVINGEPVTGLFRLKNRTMLPPIPRTGIRTSRDFLDIPDVEIIASDTVSPAPDGSGYAFLKQESRWNLYRVPLP
jgi:hypothetical protein